MIVSGVTMTLCVVIARQLIPYGGRMYQQLGLIILLSLIGVIAYFGMAVFLKIPERKMVLNKVKKL